MSGEAPPPYEPKAPAAGFHVPPSQPPYPTTSPGMPVPASVQVVTQPAPSTVIVMQPTRHVMLHEFLPPVPTLITCPSCQHSVTTRVDHIPGTRTHLWALILCLFGCWLCCCLPYLMNSCKNANHYCPRCGNFIGTSFNS